jgi:hypothetical protein
MRTRASVDILRGAILAALGLAAPGCGSSEISFPCEDPQPILAQGQDSGFDMCKGGFRRRREPVTCPNALPRAAMCMSTTPETNACSTDADCTEKPNGFCQNFGFADGPAGCTCDYGCVTDADCGAGSVCMCGDPVGHCVTASCSSTADCEGGSCSEYITLPGCGGAAFACQTPDDECASDADCAENQQCTRDGEKRICEDISCVIGRPFLVAGAARVAGSSARADWLANGVAPALEGLTSALRGELRDRWSRAGLMEHASIAAFARFTLHLLQMGAPPDLVRLSQEAMGDETEHARLCFALASAYGGASVGPGPLPIAGSLDETDTGQILAMVIREGCIGETVAALEAAEGRDSAVDPAVRGVLGVIARDEARHAELAWRTVGWALEHGDAALRAAVRAELERVIQEDYLSINPEWAPVANPERDLLRHGLAGDALRSELRVLAMRQVIQPAARALLDQCASTFGTSKLSARRDIQDAHQ